MSELIEDVSEENILVVEDDDAAVDVDVDDVDVEDGFNDVASLDARRRLESLLDEKRLRNELKDFLDD